MLQTLYSVRSQRLLLEEIDYSVLFRWFVGMDMDQPVWDAAVFTKNRDHLLEHAVAKAFFTQVWQQAEGSNMLGFLIRIAKLEIPDRVNVFSDCASMTEAAQRWYTDDSWDQKVKDKSNVT